MSLHTTEKPVRPQQSCNLLKLEVTYLLLCSSVHENSWYMKEFLSKFNKGNPLIFLFKFQTNL